MSPRKKDPIASARQKKVNEMMKQHYPRMPKSVRFTCVKQFEHNIRKPFHALTSTDRLVKITVMAFVRHRLTDYDHLIRDGITKTSARKKVGKTVREILKQWEGGNGG